MNDEQSSGNAAQPRPASFLQSCRQICWPFGVLARRVQAEVALLTLFYSAAYLGLVCIAIGGRLVAYGAPLWDVITSLPLQLAFPAAIALPLAFVTAAATVGRMQEDGETIALAASGISRVIAWYCLPVAILVISAVGHLPTISCPRPICVRAKNRRHCTARPGGKN